MSSLKMHSGIQSCLLFLKKGIPPNGFEDIVITNRIYICGQ